MTETWRKSSYSGAQEGSDCVEMALGRVRDSKNQTGPVLSFEAGVLDAFLACVKTGRWTS